MRAIGIIPARWQATRLPGKPLADIAGRPMIQHVYERSRQAASLAEVLVATDDERVFDAVRGFGGEVVMTSADHASGTDRIAEAARTRTADIVVNIQGDEPLIDPDAIDAMVAPFATEPGLEMSTLAVPISSPRDIEDPGVVKVVFDRRGYALYFSRYPIPFHRDDRGGVAYHRHLGLYAYTTEFLQAYAGMRPAPLEQTEKLEQLRVLENGHRIFVVITDHDGVGVDTPEDLARVRAIMEGRDG
jgi:3-deoxy-manno-octulosonate cytidylyltransferase (CMP-KDO synthetase)